MLEKKRISGPNCKVGGGGGSDPAVAGVAAVEAAKGLVLGESLLGADPESGSHPSMLLQGVAVQAEGDR